MIMLPSDAKEATPLTFVTDGRTLLQFSLLPYGEEGLARRVPSFSEAEMRRIYEVAKRQHAALGIPAHSRGPNDGLTRKLSKVESRAAIEVVEGVIRPAQTIS